MCSTELSPTLSHVTLCVRGAERRGAAQRRQFYLLPNSASSFSRGEFISYDGESEGKEERLPQWDETYIPKRLKDGLTPPSSIVILDLLIPE